MTTKRREWWIDNDDNEIFSIKPIEIGRDCEYYHVTEIHPGESIVSGELLDEVKELVMLICGSDPSTPIKGRIESLAFGIGHWPTILNHQGKETP